MHRLRSVGGEGGFYCVAKLRFKPGVGPKVFVSVKGSFRVWSLGSGQFVVFLSSRQNGRAFVGSFIGDSGRGRSAPVHGAGLMVLCRGTVQ